MAVANEQLKNRTRGSHEQFSPRCVLEEDMLGLRLLVRRVSAEFEMGSVYRTWKLKGFSMESFHAFHAGA